MGNVCGQSEIPHPPMRLAGNSCLQRVSPNTCFPEADPPQHATQAFVAAGPFPEAGIQTSLSTLARAPVLCRQGLVAGKTPATCRQTHATGQVSTRPASQTLRIRVGLAGPASRRRQTKDNQCVKGPFFHGALLGMLVPARGQRR